MSAKRESRSKSKEFSSSSLPCVVIDVETTGNGEKTSGAAKIPKKNLSSDTRTLARSTTNTATSNHSTSPQASVAAAQPYVLDESARWCVSISFLTIIAAFYPPVEYQSLYLFIAILTMLVSPLGKGDTRSDSGYFTPFMCFVAFVMFVLLLVFPPMAHPSMFPAFIVLVMILPPLTSRVIWKLELIALKRNETKLRANEVHDKKPGNAGIIGENGPAPGSSLTSSIQNRPEATANVPPVKRPPNANPNPSKNSEAQPLNPLQSSLPASKPSQTSQNPAKLTQQPSSNELRTQQDEIGDMSPESQLDKNDPPGMEELLSIRKPVSHETAFLTQEGCFCEGCRDEELPAISPSEKIVLPCNAKVQTGLVVPNVSLDPDENSVISGGVSQSSLPSQLNQESLYPNSSSTSDSTLNSTTSSVSSPTQSVVNVDVHGAITNDEAPLGSVSNSQKQWHMQMNSEMREQFIDELVNYILPTNYVIDKDLADRPVAMEDRTVQNFELFLKNCVRTVESNIYNAADSWIEYSHSVVDKCENFREEIAKLEANEKEQPELQENQLEQQQPPKQSELLEYLIASAKSTCRLTKP